jgi:hypothetical protein
LTDWHDPWNRVLLLAVVGAVVMIATDVVSLLAGVAAGFVLASAVGSGLGIAGALFGYRLGRGHRASG